MSRYIDADALIKRWNNMSVRGRTEFDQEIMVAPSIDIVFCKECKYEDDCEQEVLLSEMYGEIEDTAHITYCSYGERREP